MRHDDDEEVEQTSRHVVFENMDESAGRKIRLLLFGHHLQDPLETDKDKNKARILTSMPSFTLMPLFQCACSSCLFQFPHFRDR